MDQMERKKNKFKDKKRVEPFHAHAF